MKNKPEDIMNQAIEQARTTMNQDIGGPFGAAIVDHDGNLIAVASNSVLKDHDATAHAEINAIRKASAQLGTHDLTGCTLYTTAYPCPMCLGAIIWANIKTVIYGCRATDAEAIGFRDDFIYRFIESGRTNGEILSLTEKHRDACLTLFQEYEDKAKELY
ncbi:MAG: nucleoside deaminase [Candidatus Izemoplasmatales bacterium]|nr:nucleoside deaminase [Candidatus Izemoplasmatales bacterium]